MNTLGTQDGFFESESFGIAKRYRLKRRARLRQGRRMHLHRPVAKRFRGISGRIAFIALGDRLEAGTCTDDDLHALTGEPRHGVDREERGKQQRNEQGRKDQSSRFQLSQSLHHAIPLAKYRHAIQRIFQLGRVFAQRGGIAAECLPAPRRGSGGSGR
ncbi:hypothetical protein OEG86_11765 [Hoeflea alexandrii]|uniref:hypothetical protein n=1 Tax=Hoeflea alexandrii TaxID=288436 RepID=UPI00226DE662|nr:hypothetical protein [Hoeflea alexandrii]MCY0152803.1 hypothetical protein [Hoeflea alexandrii]